MQKDIFNCISQLALAFEWTVNIFIAKVFLDHNGTNTSTVSL